MAEISGRSPGDDEIERTLIDFVERSVVVDGARVGREERLVESGRVDSIGLLQLLARIGPGLYIGHSGGIWVAPGAVIGRDCNLAQGVTLGVGGTLRRGSPRLGDRVWVGPKATLSGPLVVGNGAVIGANSLVVSNVPERGVAVGVPARVVALSGSGALIG